MAFGEIELKLIENTVGEMCQRRSPAQLRDKVRTVYLITKYSVEVYEQKTIWNNREEWTNTGIAKFLYTKTTKKWKLYWVRQDGKWHLYETLSESTTIETLVEEVDKDLYSTFWG